MNVSWISAGRDCSSLISIRILLDIFIVITHHNPTYRPLITPTDYLFFFPPLQPSQRMPCWLQSEDMTNAVYFMFESCGLQDTTDTTDSTDPRAENNRTERNGGRWENMGKRAGLIFRTWLYWKVSIILSMSSHLQPWLIWLVWK